jgi:hypothetical protein
MAADLIRALPTENAPPCPRGRIKRRLERARTRGRAGSERIVRRLKFLGRLCAADALRDAVIKGCAVD